MPHPFFKILRHPQGTKFWLRDSMWGSKDSNESGDFGWLYSMQLACLSRKNWGAMSDLSVVKFLFRWTRSSQWRTEVLYDYCRVHVPTCTHVHIKSKAANFATILWITLMIHVNAFVTFRNNYENFSYVGRRTRFDLLRLQNTNMHETYSLISSCYLISVRFRLTLIFTESHAVNLLPHYVECFWRPRVELNMFNFTREKRSSREGS